MPGGQDALDRTVIDRLVDDLGDVDTVRAVADVYLDQLPTRLGELRDTALTDPVVCRRVAHGLKSASAVLGLTTVSDLCRQLELSSPTESARVPELVRAVEDASGDAADALRAWLAAT